MQHRASDFGGRFEYEFPERHARMGHGQVGGVDDLLSVEQHVDVDCPSVPTLGTFASERCFDLLQDGCQRLRLKTCFEEYRPVQEFALPSSPPNRRGRMPTATC